MLQAHHLVLTLLLSLGSVAAQGAPTGAGATDLVHAAEEHLDADRPDDAIIKLWHAERRLLQDGSGSDAAASDTLRDIVSEMLRETDPLDQDRRQLAVTSAKQLVALARGYSSKKWYDMAMLLLDEAEALMPGSSQAARAKLAGKVRGRPEPAAAMPAPIVATDKPEPTVDLLRRIKIVDFVGKWKREASGIRSPPLQNSVLMLGKSPVHGDDDLEIEIRIGAHGKAALAFGVANISNFYLAEINLLEGGRSCLSLYQLSGRTDMKRLGETFFNLPVDAITSWLRLRVEVRGVNIVASVNGLGHAAIECPTKPHGSVGLFISDNSPNKKPVTFRNLSITAPAATPAATSDNYSPADQARQGLTTAESQLADKQTESGVVELCRVRHQLAGIEVGDDSAAMAARIGTLLTEHDILHRKHDDTRSGIAGAYLDLGSRYLDGKRPRAALVLYEYALHHDRATAATKVDELRSTLAPAAKPADEATVQPVAADEDATNDQLREWFTGGRQFRKTGWEWTDNHLASPLIEGGSALHVSKKKISGRGETKVEIRMTGGSCAGFAFAVRSKHDFYLLSLEQNAAGSALAVTRYYSNQWQLVTRRKASQLPRDTWIPVTVIYGDEELVFQVAGQKPLAVKREEFHLRGATMCGLYAWADAIAGTAHFRNLDVQLMPKSAR